MKKINKLDLRIVAKGMGTKVHKTKNEDIGGYVKYRTSTIKGIVYEDGSGGLTMKVPGLNFFIDNGKVWEQIKEIEDTIKAYELLKPDLKKLKKAITASKAVLPVKPKLKVKTNGK